MSLSTPEPDCFEGKEEEELVDHKSVSPLVDQQGKKKPRKVYQANPERLASLRSHCMRMAVSNDASEGSTSPERSEDASENGDGQNPHSPDRLQCSLFAGNEQQTYEEAVSSKDAIEWKIAIQSEYKALLSSGSWKLAKLPLNNDANKHVLRHLVQTKSVGIILGGNLQLKAYTNSDYAE